MNSYSEDSQNDIEAFFDTEIGIAPELFESSGIPKIYRYALVGEREKFNDAFHQYEEILGEASLRYLVTDGIYTCSRKISTGLLQIASACYSADVVIKILQRFPDLNLPLYSVITVKLVDEISNDLSITNCKVDSFIVFIIKLFRSQVIKINNYKFFYGYMVSILDQSSELLKRYGYLIFMASDTIRAEYASEVQSCLEKIKKLEVDLVCSYENIFFGDSLESFVGSAGVVGVVGVAIKIIRQQTELLI